MFKKLTVLLIALGVLSGCVAAINVPICGQRQQLPINGPNSVENSFGQPLRWSQNAFPIRVTLDPNLGDERRSAAFEAMLVWNQQTGLEVFTYAGEGPNPEQTGTIWVTESELGSSPCGGQYYGFAHRLYEADILGIKTSINRGWVEFHSDVPQDRITSTAIHEFGHMLGLNHDPEIESIMFPFNQPDRTNQITQEDIQYVIDMIVEPRNDPFYFEGTF